LRFNHAPARIVLREASVRAAAFKVSLNIRLDKYRVNERKLRPGFLGDVGRPDFRTPIVAHPRATSWETIRLVASVVCLRWS
jgi:hypothetical protein